MKFTDYEQTTLLNPSDVFVFDGSRGTKGINASELYYSLLDASVPVGQRRNIYRAKHLGTTISADQKANIRNASFKGFFIGDYWVINNVNWRIADINYWMDSGDLQFVKPHLVIMPDKALYTGVMNDTDTTTGGYVGSLMYREGLNQAKQMISDAFGDLILTRREYLVDSVTGGKPAGGHWYDSSVEIPDERMFNGYLESSPVSDGSIIPGNGISVPQQLSLFHLYPKFSIDRSINTWCRNIVSTQQYSIKGFAGRMTYERAGMNYGVRPAFAIG